MYEAELFVSDGFANCSKTYPTSFSPGTSMALEEGGKRAWRWSAFMQAWEHGLPSTEFNCPHFDVAGDHLHGGMFRHLNARDHQCAVPSCKHATSFTNLTLSSSLNQFGNVLIICTDTPIIQTAKWKCAVLVLLLSCAVVSGSLVSFEVMSSLILLQQEDQSTVHDL